MSGPKNKQGPPGRELLVRQIVEGGEALMHALASSHAPDFLEIAITMPQAKALYLVAAAGRMHMSELCSRLGVSLSTVSGLVDRLVDQDLVDRRDDPADRRQVILSPTPACTELVGRFRELNSHQLRSLVDRLTDGELEIVERAITLLSRSAARTADQSSVSDRGQRPAGDYSGPERTAP